MITQYKVCSNFVIMNGNKVLLQKRKNTGYQDGMWALVGGHIEDRESVFQATKREAKEELGIDVELNDMEIVHCIQLKTNKDYIHYFVMIKKFKGIPKIIETDKADDLRYFDLNELPDNVAPSDRQGLEAINKGIRFSIFGFGE